MKISEQTKLWVAGKPIHNKERDECCPDFSCCNPKLLAPKKIRQKFYKAELEGDSKTKNVMLMMFLGKLISAIPSKPKVYITG